MGKRLRGDDDDRYRLWWEETFSEREGLLRERFGETDPAGYVNSFSWSDFRLTIPGGCALVFPPVPQERPHWLYLSHGLTQPLKPEPKEPGRWSGYGCEFGILTNGPCPWALQVLYQVLTYIKADEAMIGVGHRVPVAFFDREHTGAIEPELGLVADDDPDFPLGEVRSLLFWSYRLQPKPLWTSTGYFDILIGTTITEAERQLVRDSSATHVVYLLHRAGIGQISDLHRTTVTNDPQWREEWETIRGLSKEEVGRLMSEG